MRYCPVMEISRETNFLRLTVLMLGAGMTILAAMLTGYYGERHMRALQDVQGKIAAPERLIAEHWQDAQALRHREDSVILLAMFARNAQPVGPELGVMLAHYMEQLLSATNAPASIVTSVTTAMKNGKTGLPASYEAALAAIKSHRRATLTAIDSLYSEIQALRQEENNLQERDSRLRTLALFCQIMGLILVLAAKPGF